MSQKSTFYSNMNELAAKIGAKSRQPGKASVSSLSDKADSINYPQLNPPTISVSTSTLTISNPATNGSFVQEYQVYIDGSLYTTSSSTSVDLSNATESYAQVAVKCVAQNFENSTRSNLVVVYKYFSITMMDDDMTTVLSTQSVRYGLMPTYAPAKAGYEFQYWVDSNGNQVTTITSEITLYAVWVQITNWVYKNSYELQRFSSADSYYNTIFTLGCKVSPNGKYIIFWGGTNTSGKYPSCTFVKLETDFMIQINYDGLRTTGANRKVYNGIFSPDSTKFYFWYGSNSQIYIGIMDTSNLSKTIPSTKYASSTNPISGPICISPDGNIAATYYSGKLYIHNLTNYSYTTYSSASSCYGIKYSDDGNYIYVWNSTGLYVHYVNEGYSYERVGTFSPGASFNMNYNKYIRYNSTYFGQLVDSTVQQLKANLPIACGGSSGYSGVAFSQKSNYSIETYNNATTPVLFHQINSAYSQMTTPELPEGETLWAISTNVKTCMSDEGNTAIVFLHGSGGASIKIYVYTRPTT